MHAPLAFALALAWASPVDAVLATVDGVPILQSQVRQLQADSATSLTDREALLALAYARVLERHARDAGIAVPDERLHASMAERVAAAGGWDAYSDRLARRGSSPEADRHEVRTALAAEAYVEHCVGRVPGSPHLRPELARRVTVLPADVREYWRRHRDEFRTDDRVVMGRLLVETAECANPAEARALAEELRRRALAPGGSLAAAAAGDDRARHATLTLGTAERASLKPPFRAFLDGAPIGARSEILDVGTAWVVLEKVEETAGRSLGFAEVQPAIFALLGQARFEAARRRLAEELLREADVWPKNLFGPGNESSSPVPSGTRPP